MPAPDWSTRGTHLSVLVTPDSELPALCVSGASTSLLDEPVPEDGFREWPEGEESHLGRGHM